MRVRLMPVIFAIFIILTGCKEKTKRTLSLSLTSGETTVSADTGKVQIIAELKDENGIGIEGAVLSFETSGGTLSELIEMGNGKYSVWLIGLNNTALSPVSVTGRYENLSQTISITIVPGAPYSLDLLWEPVEVNADSGEVNFTAKIRDYNGNPVNDVEVSFTSSYGNFSEVNNSGNGEFRTSLNGLKDTSRSPVRVTCRAGSIQKVAEVKIKPGALNGFAISPVLDPQYVNEPFSVVLLAIDKNKNLVTDFTGRVNISPSDPGVAVTPSLSAPFSGGVLRQENIRISGTSSALTLRFDNGAGVYALTNPFDVINVPSVDHFTIDAIPSPQIAGEPFIIRVVARDSGNGIVANFNGTVSISDTTGTISPSLSGKFSKGVLTQDVYITKAMTGVTITVNGSTGGSGVSNAFDVNPSPMDHFEFASISSPQILNSPFSIMVTSVDAYGNIVRSFNGTVDITDTTGTIVPSTSTNFIDGALLQQVKIGKLAVQDVITVKDNAGHSGQSNPFEVATVNLDHFTISPISNPQTAGASFTIMIEAKDSTNATVTQFNGTVTLRDNTKTIEPVISKPFVSGVLIQDIKIYKAITNNTITVSWNGKTGMSNTFDVVPSSLNRFLFSQITSPIISGQPSSITIEAVDLYGNRVNYNGTVNFSDLTGTISPGTSNNFTNGILTQNITISKTIQSDIIIASDAGITGTSNAFEVKHGPLDHFSFDADPVTPGIQGISSPQRNGSPFTIRVYARDAMEQLVNDFNGTVSLTDLTGTITPVSGVFNNGILTLSVTINANRNGNTITVTDGQGHTGVSTAFDVSSGLQVLCFDIDPIGTPQIAGQPFQITVTARKSDCNGVPDNSFNGTVNLIDSSGTLKPYISGSFTNGVLNQIVTVERAGSDQITIEGAGLIFQSNPFTVLPGGLDHFTLSQITSPQQVDIPFGITVTAVDAFNNRVTGFNGTVRITDRSGSLNITSNPFIFGNLNQNVSITKVLNGDHLLIDDLSGHTGSSNAFDVVPRPLDHFAISNILSPQIEDEPISITIVAQDATGRTVTTFDGNVSFEDTTGSISPPVSDYFIGGVLTQDVKIGIPTSNTAITVSDGAGHTGQSNAFAVEPSYAGVAGYEIDLIPTPQVAGTDFTIKIRAVDSQGEVVSGFSGYVNITDSTGTITPETSGSFVNGVVSEQVRITRADKNVTIRVRDVAGNTGTSNPFNVIPGALDHFAIANIADQKVNVPFTISVTALDAYNNTVSGFNGTVNIIDLTGTIQPTTSAPFSGGILSQEVTIGAQSPADIITVVEPGSGATGTSNFFAVQP